MNRLGHTRRAFIKAQHVIWHLEEAGKLEGLDDTETLAIGHARGLMSEALELLRAVLEERTRARPDDNANGETPRERIEAARDAIHRFDYNLMQASLLLRQRPAPPQFAQDVEKVLDAMLEELGPE